MLLILFQLVGPYAIAANSKGWCGKALSLFGIERIWRPQLNLRFPLLLLVGVGLGSEMYLRSGPERDFALTAQESRLLEENATDWTFGDIQREAPVFSDMYVRYFDAKKSREPTRDSVSRVVASQIYSMIELEKDPFIQTNMAEAIAAEALLNGIKLDMDLRSIELFPRMEKALANANTATLARLLETAIVAKYRFHIIAIKWEAASGGELPTADSKDEIPVLTREWVPSPKAHWLFPFPLAGHRPHTITPATREIRRRELVEWFPAIVK